MGFLDKLKSVKNFVTGGGATVTVEVTDAGRGAAFPVTVRATVADAAMKVGRVYVIVKAEEEIDVRARVRESDGDSEHHHVRHDEDTFKTEVDIAAGESLEAGQSYEWTGEIELPDDALPTYLGRNCRHRWYVQGALDVTGNDPDSGWIEFHVS